MTEKLTTLSDRLQYAVKQVNISQVELARRVNMKSASLNYLLSSSANSTCFAPALAKALGIRLEWLMSGEGVIFIKDDPIIVFKNSYREIPCLSIEEVTNWLSKEGHTDTTEFTVTGPVGKKSFALQVNENVLAPLVKTNDILIMDTSAVPKNGDIVVAKLKEPINSVVLRQFCQCNGGYQLQSSQASLYETLSFSRGDTVLATAIEARKDRASSVL